MKTKQLGTSVIGGKSTWNLVQAWTRLMTMLAWNEMYRALVEDGLGSVSLRPPVKLTDISVLLTHQRYQPDGVKQLGDARHSGEWLASYWGTLNSGCDCDDFATFICHMVQTSVVQETYSPWLLSVFTEKGGHSVALLKGPLGYCYMDYGKPSAHFATVLEAVEDVAKQAFGQSALYFVMEAP